MRAHILHNPGEDAQPVLIEVPKPRPGPGEVLVENHFAALNWGIRRFVAAYIPSCRICASR